MTQIRCLKVELTKVAGLVALRKCQIDRQVGILGL